MKQFFKIALGGAGALALVVTFALGRSAPPAPVVAASEEFNETWNSNMRGVALKSADVRSKIAVAEPEPIHVLTERISPNAPVKVPPVVMLQEDKPAARHRRHYPRAERNVCTRHGMRKVETKGGKSWRCRR